MSENSTHLRITDLPYRCPQCHKNGKIKDFASLPSLKDHLKDQHGYSSRSKEFNGRISPLTESFHDELKILEDKLKQAKKDEERNKCGENADARAGKKRHIPLHSTIPYTPKNNLPNSSPRPHIYGYLGTNYQSNHLIRNAPLYLGPHKFDQKSQFSMRGAMGAFSYGPNIPIATTGIKNEHGNRNQNIKDNQFKYQEEITESKGTMAAKPDETLSKMLDKTEGDLSALKLQVENNMHPHEAKNMVQTLNIAKNQVENLRKTAEKITGEQQVVIDRLQSQLKNRDEQMKKAKKELNNLRDDRNKLRRDLDDHEQKTTQTQEELEIMKKFVEEKEETITLKERELEDMSEFIKSASTHEADARNKLEKFIGDILDRAQKAEDEVQSLKSQLSLTPLLHSQATTPLFNLHQNVPAIHSPLNSTFKPIVHSTPAPLLHRSPSPAETGRTTPIAAQRLSDNPLIRLSPGQSEPDFSVPPFPGYKAPANADPSVPQLRRKVIPGRIYGTSDSGIGSNSSSRATMYGAVPNQHYPMATVMEDGYFQQNSLGVDENGILWEEQHNRVANAMSPPYERRSGTRRTHPSFSSQDREQITDWKRNAAHVLEMENKELKERLKSLQKKQKHLQNERRMAAAHGLVTDTEDANEESESEYVTVEDSSDVEHSDLDKNHTVTDQLSSEEIDSRGKSPKSILKSQRMLQTERLLARKEQRYSDALFCVFMYLDTKTLCVISEVCKGWKDISRHPALWRKLDFTHSKISSKFLKTISGWSTQLQSLTLEGLKGRKKLPRENTADYLKNTRGCLEEGLEHLLAASQNTLVSLKIIDCGNILTDRSLYLAGCYSRLLQRIVYISDSHPAGAEAIWTLGAGCRDIMALIIPPLFPSQKPRRFDNGCVKKIGQCWPNLRVVCIGGVNVNTKGLVSLVRSCPRLSVLELDHMCEIGEEDAHSMCAVGLKGLQHLDFTFTPVTPKAILYFISACPQLGYVGVHVGISDYFEDTTSTQSRQHYKEIVLKLNSLLKRSSVKEILHIKTDYG